MSRSEDIPPSTPQKGRVRLLRSEDIPQVADLFRSVFRNRGSASSTLLDSHLVRLFLEHPHYSEDTASLVYEGASGEVAGMLGVLPLRMRFDDSALDGSIISAWMVRDRTRDAHASVLLARSHLKRNHAVTLSDTASRTSIEFHAALRFDFSAAHCMQWVKPLNFLACGSDLLARGVGLDPPAIRAAAHTIERVARHVARKRGARTLEGWQTQDVPSEVFAHSFLSIIRRYRLRPDWSIPDVAWMLRLASERKSCGTLRVCEARDEAGELAGACAYFEIPRGRAEILQIVARPRAEEGVLHALIEKVRREGGAYVCGRVDPAVARGLFRIPGVFYRHSSGTVVRARTPEIFRAFASGEGLVGGLVGDAWSPLTSESYV